MSAHDPKRTLRPAVLSPAGFIGERGAARLLADVCRQPEVLGPIMTPAGYSGGSGDSTCLSVLRRTIIARLIGSRFQEQSTFNHEGFRFFAPTAVLVEKISPL